MENKKYGWQNLTPLQGSEVYRSTSLLYWNSQEMPPPHDYLDDLESIFLVLIQIILQYADGPGIVVRENWLPDHTSLGKDNFISNTRHRISKWWGQPIANLITGYQVILGPIIKEKKYIHDCKDTPKEKAINLLAFNQTIGDTYKELETLFDLALGQIQTEDAAKIVAASASDSSRPSPHLAPAGNAVAARDSTADQVEESPTIAKKGKRGRNHSGADADVAIGSESVDTDSGLTKRPRRSTRVAAKASGAGMR